MTEFHIEIPPMARIGKWKSKFPRRQVIDAKKNNEMFNLMCRNWIRSRGWCSLHLWTILAYCGGLGSLTSKVHRYSVLTIGQQRIFIGWLPLIHTLLLNGLCCRSKCSKWDASLASSAQYNPSHILHIISNTTRILCTIQLVTSLGFAYSLQYNSRLLSLLYNTIYFLHLLRNSHLTSEIICSNSG